MARALSRQSFDQVRADERARLRGLEAAAADFGLGVDHPRVRGAWDAGVSPETFRAALDRQRAEHERIANAIRPDPRGPLAGPAARVAALMAFGRGDLAAAHAAEHDVEDRGGLLGLQPREALCRVASLTGEAAGADTLLRLAFGAIAAGAGRAEFAAGGGTAGAAPASEFGPAIRDAAMMIVAHEWPRGGRVWRAVARPVMTSWVDRATRCYVSASGGTVEARERPEGAIPETEPLTAWPYGDVTTKFRDSGKFKPSRTRVVNAGGVEYGAYLAAAVAREQQSLDAAVGSLLESAKVPTAAGTFDLTHIAAAVTALNQQTVDGLRISRSMPLLVAGEGRRSAAHLAPPLARADGDDSAQVAGAIVSADVPDNLIAVVSRDFMPALIGTLGAATLEAPAVRLGSAAAGMGEIGFADSDLMACLDVVRSDPALVLQGGSALGAVRLVSS